MESPIIRSQNLTKSFDGGRTFALKNVNLEIGQGEFVAIIGLSGAGKSTFLRAINGMNPPGTGTLEVLGKQVGKLKGSQLKDLRRRIGFVFQQFNLVKNLTALQNVLVGRVAYVPLYRVLTGLYPKAEIEKAKRVLDSVGLRARYTETARNLSGGQQQRVAIARALVQDPRIILADEPMASLDPKLSEVVLGILKSANEKEKITVLVNIHVLSLAKKYATRMIAFRQGEVVFDGPPEQLTDDEVERIYTVDKADSTQH